MMIGIVAILAGAGGLAYFSDTESSTGNTFQAGTMDIKIRNGSQSWGDAAITGEWLMSGMEPGVTDDEGIIMLRHTGTISGHHIEIGCSYTATEGVPTGDMDTVDQDLETNWDDFAKFVEITFFDYYDDDWHIKYDGTSFTTSGDPPQPTGYSSGDWTIDDADGISGISLCDLKNDPLNNLPPPNGGDTHFEMRVKFHEDAGNNLQGDTLDLTMKFALAQESGQDIIVS